MHQIIYNARSFVYGKRPRDASGTTASPWLVADARAQALLFDDERLLVADTGGQVFYDSSSQQNGAQLPQALLDQGVLLWDFAQDRPLGTVIIAAGPGFYTSQQMMFLRGVSWSLLISGLIAAGIALVVGVQLARRITAPVSALTQGLRRLAAGNWCDRLPVRSDDEFGLMSGAFNTMADALQTQKMLRNRLVDDLMHELNTPLSVIQLEIEAMRDGMQSPAQATEQLQREITLLRNLIDDLAVLAESEQGAQAVSTELVDMRELIRQAVARWQSKAEAKRVQLMVTASDSPLLLEADPLRISQVLGNLLSNALRYTDTNGRVVVACERVMRHELTVEHATRIMPHGAQSCIVTTVADTGCGIPAADLPFVFERFYIVDTARHRATSGRGLGLAIVRQIVERHGGNVWVDSQLHVGSSFGFSLASPLK